MKKVLMAMTMLFALGCWAQTAGSSSGQSAGSSQSGSMSNGSQSGSMSNGSQSGNMSNDQNGSMNSMGSMKGEKTLKGCIESENGGYMLEEKHGKEVMLSSSQDLSAHVGHEVKVHGMWQNGSMGSSSGSMTPNSSGSMNSNPSSNSGSMASTSSSNGQMSGQGMSDHNGQTFMVSKIDMVSTQCKMDRKNGSGGSSMH